MAGARVVVVVRATGGAADDAVSGAGTVVAGVVGTVTGAAAGFGTEVTAVTAAVAGWATDTAGLPVSRPCAEDP